MLTDLLKNKGLLIIVAIILCIVYFSPDVECIMLLTGIIVNVISICVNTGSMVGHKDQKKEKFVNMKQLNSSMRPPFEDLNEDVNFTKYIPQPMPTNIEAGNIVLPMKPIKIPKADCPHTSYEGAVDWNDNDDIYQDGNTRVAGLGINRQGVNNTRAWAGANNMKKTLEKYWNEELHAEEMETRWWAKYDE